MLHHSEPITMPTVSPIGSLPAHAEREALEDAICELEKILKHVETTGITDLDRFSELALLPLEDVFSKTEDATLRGIAWAVTGAVLEVKRKPKYATVDARRMMTLSWEVLKQIRETKRGRR